MNSRSKQSLKAVELPLNKFQDEAVPHHQKILEEYKLTIQKLMAAKDVQQLNREIKNRKQIIQQLKNLMYELDTLRAQVEDKDLSTFDARVMSLLKSMLTIVSEYGTVEKLVVNFINSQPEIGDNVEQELSFDNIAPIQLQANVDELKLQEQRFTAEQMEALEDDVQNLHGLYVQLNEMVGEQREQVEAVEQNVEVTDVNINKGIKDIIKSHKLAAATYPLTGACIGSVVGGPIGFLAGLKVGVIAAIGFGITGYVAGKIGKKVIDQHHFDDKKVPELQQENVISDRSSVKKDS